VEGRNVVGVATRYRMDGSGFQPRCGQEIFIFSTPALGPFLLLYKGYRGRFPGVKRSERGIDHLLPSSAGIRMNNARAVVPLYACLAFLGDLYLYTGGSFGPLRASKSGAAVLRLLLGMFRKILRCRGF
jgi:hypothetical protein